MLQIRTTNHFNSFGSFNISPHRFYVRNLHMQFLTDSPIKLSENKTSYYMDNILDTTSEFKLLDDKYRTLDSLTKKSNGNLVINDNGNIYGFNLHWINYCNDNIYDGTVFLSPLKDITLKIKDTTYTFKNIKYIIQSNYEMDTRGQELACGIQFVKCYTVISNKYYQSYVHLDYCGNHIYFADKKGKIMVDVDITNYGAFCGYILKGLKPTCYNPIVHGQFPKISDVPKLDHVDPYKDPDFNKFNDSCRKEFEFAKNFEN